MVTQIILFTTRKNNKTTGKKKVRYKLVNIRETTFFGSTKSENARKSFAVVTKQIEKLFQSLIRSQNKRKK